MRRLGAPFVSVLLLAALGCSRVIGALSKGDGGSDQGGGLIPQIPDLSNLNSARGRVESTGATGTWQLEKGNCYSGDPDGYFGIHVESQTDKRDYLKFVKDPLKGWNLGVSIPDTCKPISNGEECSVEYFDSKECSTLDVNLKVYTFRGKMAAGQHQFDGDVSFNCARGKSHVSGKLTIEKCSP